MLLVSSTNEFSNYRSANHFVAFPYPFSQSVKCTELNSNRKTDSLSVVAAICSTEYDSVITPFTRSYIWLLWCFRSS